MDRLTVRLLALVMAVSVGLAIAGCASSRDVVISEAEAGRKVSLSVGQRMEIALASNPTTGYSWQVADDAGGLVSLVGEPEFVQDPGPMVTGRGGSELLTFEAERAGSGTLVLEYRRPWEKIVAEKTIEVPVEVK